MQTLFYAMLLVAVLSLNFLFQLCRAGGLCPLAGTKSGDVEFGTFADSSVNSSLNKMGKSAVGMDSLMYHNPDRVVVHGSIPSYTQDKYILKSAIDEQALNQIKMDDTNIYGSSVLPGKYGTDESSWGGMPTGAFSANRMYWSGTGVKQDRLDGNDFYVMGHNLMSRDNLVMSEEMRMEMIKKLYTARNAAWGTRMYRLLALSYPNYMRYTYYFYQ